MVEHRTPNPEAGGSNPSWPAKNIMAKKKAKKNQTEAKTQTGLRDRAVRLKEFFEESKTEMKKVTYPSQKQTLTTCGSVLFLVCLIAVFLGIVDIALSKILEVILP